MTLLQGPKDSVLPTLMEAFPPMYLFTNSSHRGRCCRVAIHPNQMSTFWHILPTILLIIYTINTMQKCLKNGIGNDYKPRILG